MSELITPTPTSPPQLDVVLEAYSRLHRYGPEFGGDEEGNHGMTNHGPMAVEVMIRRGLPVNVDRWLDRYVHRLDERPDTGRQITEGTWTAALGDHHRLPDWTAWFTAQLADRPWRGVLVTWWPRLLPGIVAGSTHGVIRVGHAVRTLRAADAGGATLAPTEALAELAHGLAFWAARYRRLPALQLPAPSEPDLAGALARVPRLSEQSGLVAHRLDRLDRLAPPGRRPDEPSPTAGQHALTDLAALVDAATLGYLSYGRAAPVLLVHTATAPNAVAHVLPELPETMWAASYQAAWAAAAALTAMYAPVEPNPPGPGTAYTRTPSPDVALERAAEHGDEHVLKFTDTALDAYECRAHPGLLRAAEHAAHLIDSPA